MGLDIISGIQTANFGAPTQQYGITKDVELNVKANLTPIIKNEQGAIVTRGYGDYQSGIKLNVIFTGSIVSPPVPGTVFNFSGVNWFVEGTPALKYKNTDFTELSLEGVRSQFLIP